MLSYKVYQEILEWMHRNARPLELSLWRYYFEAGTKDAVIAELAYYQNGDGGFGQALDPDNWNPESSPYNVQFAVKLLRGIGFTDIKHSIYQGLFRYLEETEFHRDYGWMFTVPSNEGHPHAVWWDYSEEANACQSTGTTASLCGFILRFGERDTKLYTRAVQYAELLISKLRVTTELGDMGVSGYCELLEDVEASGLTDNFDYGYLKEKVPQLVREKILKEKDNFMANPLEFITSPESRYYKENIPEVEAALDLLIEIRPDKGVWGIPWEWYNGNKYPKEFAISENWWKGAKAVEKLLQLRNFNRLIYSHNK